ncbi:MAG: PGPGW domain-containing protein [Rhodospirillales bacterium]|nr:PGPGW domain-containing protein [Rhodospirillales bacterium]
MRRVKHLKSMALMLAGAICVLIGLVFLPLPPPFFGMVFIALGLPLLAAGSKRARRFIQHLRWRYYRHNAKVEYVLSKLPRILRKHGHKTRPDVLVRLRKNSGLGKHQVNSE